MPVCVCVCFLSFFFVDYQQCNWVWKLWGPVTAVLLLGSGTTRCSAQEQKPGIERILVMEYKCACEAGLIQYLRCIKDCIKAYFTQKHRQTKT